MELFEIHLFIIMSSFILVGYVQTKSVDRRVTMDKFQGRWYYMGRISNCVDNIERICTMYEIDRADSNDRYFYQARIPIDHIPNCEYGFPIYTYHVRGQLINSRLTVAREGVNPRSFSTVKSYNNGKELIFTDSPNALCPSESYRLWSRKRTVSAETYTKFDKLARTGSANYFSWDHCPKLHSSTNDNLTLEQFEGVWHDIAEIYEGKVNNDTCTSYNIIPNYSNQTFTIIKNSIENRRPIRSVFSGNIAESLMRIKKLYKYDIDIVRCNGGAELIVHRNSIPYYKLTSRNPQVSTEMLREFERLSKNYEDAHYTFYPRDNCPNRTN